ncbi:class I SAM-dependent methyltransferase [Yoonia sp. R2-816]|uniref:class I SAM-dependent methyltransferase n=1 Tax=Yoonia sp. R2-816 TaxID=3342638 RepID=UPI00372C7EB0
MSVQQNNPLRGRLNAWFLAAIDSYVNHLLHAKKFALFADLSGTVVEIGPGVGANLTYLAGAHRVIGIEPNAQMRPILERRAARRSINLEILPVGAEATGLPEASVDFVVCTLVLCTVGEPRRVLEEVRRILKPGGKFLFVEHVEAPHGSVLRHLQRLLRRPWRYVFEGCCLDRDTASLIRAVGFSSCEIDQYRLKSPFVPVNVQIAGVAVV